MSIRFDVFGQILLLNSILLTKLFNNLHRIIT